MREKLYIILNRAYGIMMFVSFFAGLVPLIPFIFAIAVGGSWGEQIAVFFYKQYYPWVIMLGSVSIIIGLLAMYISRQEGLTVKKRTDNESDDKSAKQS